MPENNPAKIDSHIPEIRKDKGVWAVVLVLTLSTILSLGGSLFFLYKGLPWLVGASFGPIFLLICYFISLVHSVAKYYLNKKWEKEIVAVRHNPLRGYA
jgi:cellulose synthase/poly-beta-1,6-N-acetylglucosamine synthase-like glycosyltransferase